MRAGSRPFGMTTDGLLAAFRSRAVPALARVISMVENGRDGYQDVLTALHPSVGRAHRIGLTGPPGAGKSTLAERLVRAYRARDLGVAVVAVDPTSPFSGGALLGDRIRMESVSLDPQVYIRSMATRGEMGGLATTTREVCDVLDAFGFDRILVETVGVGQSELTIAAAADTSVLVLVPESGDGIQVLKAGVMEVADIYAINKADRPGADRLRTEIEVMLGIRRGNAYLHMGAHHGPAREKRDGDPHALPPLPRWGGAGLGGSRAHAVGPQRRRGRRTGRRHRATLRVPARQRGAGAPSAGPTGPPYARGGGPLLAAPRLGGGGRGGRADRRAGPRGPRRKQSVPAGERDSRGRQEGDHPWACVTGIGTGGSGTMPATSGMSSS
jgi:LAO/AO transport system ATPase